MKNNIIILAITALLLTLNSSCEDAFNQVIAIKQDPIAPSLVPNAYLSNGDTARMFVSLTQDLLTNKPGKVVENAKIEVFENEVSKGIMRPDTSINGFDTTIFYKLQNFVPQPGNIYRMKVNATGYPTAEATDSMPQIVSIKATKTGKVFWKKLSSPFGGQALEDSFAEVKLTFLDVLGKDFYRIRIGDQNQNGFFGGASYGGFPVLVNDLIYTQLNGGPGGISENESLTQLDETYFNDDLFNGQTKEVLILIPLGKNPSSPGPGFNGKLFFYLQHHSRASYLHNKSLVDYQRVDGNPFSQPVLIYSNYKNGFGILGSSCTSVDSLIFQ
jgi:Domain of unknown function (DUF4249)